MGSIPIGPGGALCADRAGGVRTGGRPRRAASSALHNEIAIEDATRRTALGVDDPVAVFAFIFGALPDRVRVYPTENYFYFSFFHNGTRYAGNIRLAVVDRDNGKLHFEYYQDVVEWMGKGRAHHAVLDASQGVTVELVERQIGRAHV